MSKSNYPPHERWENSMLDYRSREDKKSSYTNNCTAIGVNSRFTGEAPALESSENSSWEDLASILGPIQWAWDKWLPMGMLTILASESGIGKSALALQICASFLTGVAFPDGTPYNGKTGKVLWIEAEAAQAINLERANNWKLPISNIITPLENPLDDVRLDNSAHKRAVQIAINKEDVLFMVVDSLRGTAGGDENSSEFMNVAKWLAELARDSGKPTLLIHHLRKPNFMDNGNGPNLSMLRGSSAIVQPARVIWALDRPDPDLKDEKRLQVIKSNLGHFPQPIGLRIDSQGIVFGEAPEPPRSDTVTNKAVDLLQSLLSRGPLLAKRIEDEFKDAGISWKTAGRAKKKLGIISVRKIEGWYWSLPACQ